MSVFCLEMRSTDRWDDVRYREYTRSQRKALAFKAVPRIDFTDSGHGIIPTVCEYSGARLPRNHILADYVIPHVRQAMLKREDRT